MQDITQTLGSPKGTIMTESNVDEVSELDLLKSTLCMKEHEIFTLRNQLECQFQSTQMLAAAVERMEKTMAASYDRLVRRLERAGCISEQDTRNKRRRHV